MAIRLWGGNFTLFIPIAIVDIYYPGGFNKYKLDNIEKFSSEYYGVFYDDDLVTEGSMDGGDDMVEEWRKFGVNITKIENNVNRWDEVCIIGYFTAVFGEEVPCDWLNITDKVNVEMKTEWKNKNKWIRKTST